MKLIGVLLCLLAINANDETVTGYVVEITDGDTIVVLDANRQQHKIRLAGIDAPESNQAFGSRSTESIANLTFNKTVTVEWKKKDRGRLIGKVLLNGVDINLEQVRAGMAWWYVKYAKEQSPADRRLYAQAEQQARAQRVGLWKDASPTPPWEFRHAKDGAQPQVPCPCSEAVSCTGPKGGAVLHYREWWKEVSVSAYGFYRPVPVIDKPEGSSVISSVLEAAIRPPGTPTGCFRARP